MDVARGFALLGIFLVNIASFSGPFGDLISSRPPPGTGAVDRGAAWIVDVLCQGKFYGLFSLLFGIGFALQRERLLRAGRGFVALYLRRLFFLGALGACHAILLWYGDILFVYSVTALVLLILIPLRAKTLVIVAVSILSVSILITGVFSALTYEPDARQATANAPADSIVSSEAAEQAKTADGKGASGVTPAGAKKEEEKWGEFGRTPVGRLLRGMENHESANPAGSLWRNTELEVYGNGPYSQAVLMRAFTWVIILFVFAFGMGWPVAAMFLIGAALVKTNAFAPERRPLHWKFVQAGLFVGLPICATGVIVGNVWHGRAGTTIEALCQVMGSPLMSLGYLGGMTLLTASGRARGVVKALGSAGRMALTNYLMQTVIACAIFQHWGLRLFGTVAPAMQVLIVLGIYAMQLGLSMVWMRGLRFGPMEWVWRAFTYLRIPEMKREARSA